MVNIARADSPPRKSKKRPLRPIWVQRPFSMTETAYSKHKEPDRGHQRVGVSQDSYVHLEAVEETRNQVSKPGENGDFGKVRLHGGKQQKDVLENL